MRIEQKPADDCKNSIDDGRFAVLTKMPIHYYTAICALNRNLLMMARSQLMMEGLQRSQ